MAHTIDSCRSNLRQRLRGLPGLLGHWCSDDARYYFLSALIHAILLLSLGLVPWVVYSRSRDAGDSENAVAIDPVERESGETPDMTRFERGEVQIEPSILNSMTIAQFKNVPLGDPSGDSNLKPEETGKPGGGTPDGVENLFALGIGVIHGDSENGPGSPYQNRTPGGLGTGIKPGIGGDKEGIGNNKHLVWGPTGPSELAVGFAIDWLARHQASNGAWHLDHRKECKGAACSAGGMVKSDAAATGFAILPFLAYGEKHRGKSAYAKQVNRGINWLIKQQEPSGNLAGATSEKPLYAHAIATLALCEAYGMTKDDSKTRDENLGSACRRAINYLERAQNESTGSWRYTPGEAGDTSVFGWVIMALKSAQLADIPVNSTVFDRAPIWLNSVAKGEHLGLYSYLPYREVTPTMTSVGMLCRQYLGIDKKDPSILEGKAYLLQNLPDGVLSRNSYYWYYASLAMHNFNDADWDTWHRRLRKILIESQATEGCAAGSWDPERPSLDYYGQQGGRLMTTCLNTLTLEVYYRHIPLFRTDSLLPEIAPAVPLEKQKPENKDAKK